MPTLTCQQKAWNDTFPEVTKTQYLVLAYLLSWQDAGGQSAVEVGLRVGERPYHMAGSWARSVLKALANKGYVVEMPPVTADAPPERPSSHPRAGPNHPWRHTRSRYVAPKQCAQRKWQLTLHGCLYLKNYPMPE